MFKIGLIAVALSLSVAVHAGNQIELVYSDLRFSIPAGFAAVGDIGDQCGYSGDNLHRLLSTRAKLDQYIRAKYYVVLTNKQNVPNTD